MFVSRLRRLPQSILFDHSVSFGYRLPPGGFAGALPFPELANGDVGVEFFGLSFFGFFASRLLRCSPFAIAFLLYDSGGLVSVTVLPPSR